ncbi:hypothetical protein [Clostridium scatologenes]|uniref:Uncharacterized protein n=1 Tax=Clostridium scatologenes TaxID=1548 RepID=A0A0E3K3F9_CLOSL|nr:hypothetical protein [Clostridium scatologenes]AKA71218.1 hypothetical protein CSCA_4093 [Clostridium scatologenes]
MKYIIDNDRIDKLYITEAWGSIADEYMYWTDVIPKDWGIKEHDTYKCFSINGSGWNTDTGLFHLEAKTWIWFLKFTVLEDGFYVGWTWSYGKYININTTYNVGDEVIIPMAKIVEFGKKGSINSSSVKIEAYYLLPFVEWWPEGIKNYANSENQLNSLKDRYLKSKMSPTSKRTFFNNGYPKFVMDDTIASLFDNAKDLKNMKLIHEEGIGGQQLEQLIYIYNYPYIPLYFENIK